MGKAQTRLTEIDRVNILGIQKRELYGLLRRNSNSGPLTNVGLSSGGGQGGNTGSTNVTGYLSTSGGAMQGAIAFNNISTTIVTNAINITKNTGAYSTYVSIAESGVTDLKTITGAHDDGQFLIIQYLGSSTVTIKGGGIGNIVNFGFADYALNNGDVVQYIFSSLFNSWFQVSSGLAGAGANKALSNLTTTAINQDLIFGGGMSDSTNSKNLTNVHIINFASTGGASNLVTMGTGKTPSTFSLTLGTQSNNLLCYLGVNSETNLEILGSPSGAQAAPIFRVFTQRTPTNGMLCGTYSFDGNDDFTTQQQFVLLQGIARNKNRSLSNLAGALDIFVWSQNNTSAQTKVATFEGDTTNLGTAGGLVPGLSMNGNQMWGLSYLTLNTNATQQFNGTGAGVFTTSSLILSGGTNLMTWNITDTLHAEKGYSFQIGTFDIIQILNNNGFVVSSDVGFVNFTSQNSYTSATAGTHALPALVKEYLIVMKNGVAYKIPLYGL